MWVVLYKYIYIHISIVHIYPFYVGSGVDGLVILSQSVNERTGSNMLKSIHFLAKLTIQSKYKDIFTC